MYEWVSTDITCVTATSSPIAIEGLATVKVRVSDFTWKLKFLVSRNLGMGCILGADFISKAGLVLDIQSQYLYFKFNRRVKIPLVNSNDPDLVNHTSQGKVSKAI